VDKRAVVAHIEFIALRLGLDIEGPAGERLFGGHSLRVTGAQWMAGLGIPLATIQLIARWSSDVVTRYVGEAPLKDLTSTYRRAAAARDIEQIQSTPAFDPNDLKSDVLKLTTQILDEFKAEFVNARAPASAEPCLVTFCSLPFVVRPMANGRPAKLHKVSTRDTGAKPPREWRTACGWAFGRTEHCFSSSPNTASQCAACCRLPDVCDGTDDE